MWMLPEDWVYGGWPMSGEIDIVEIIGKLGLNEYHIHYFFITPQGNEDLKIVGTGEDVGIQKMGATTHWGVWWDQNRWYLTTNHKFVEHIVSICYHGLSISDMITTGISLITFTIM